MVYQKSVLDNPWQHLGLFDPVFNLILSRQFAHKLLDFVDLTHFFEQILSIAMAQLHNRIDARFF